MTAAELIEQLQLAPPDRLIVMSKDGEGNDFSPLAEADLAVKYVADSTWSGDVLHPDDHDAYDPDGMVDAICLWPVN